MIEPYSAEWWNARRGKITPSDRLHTILFGRVKTKNAMLDKMVWELSDQWERSEEIHTAGLDHGKRFESQAKAMIEFTYDVELQNPGLVQCESHPILVGTPDYVTTFEGRGITGEIKCPLKPEVHQGFLYKGVIADKNYYTQVQGEMFLTGHTEAWFHSYSPDQPAASKLSRDVVLQDAALFARIREELDRFTDMLKTGRRFAEGKTTTLSGIPQLF